MKLLREENTVSLQTTLKKGFLAPKSFLNLPFERIKNGILGRKYELSIVLIGRKKMKAMNKKHRGKDYATDVLSFEIGKDMGEIFICPEIAKSKSGKFNMDAENYLLFLVIHGCLHLKGMEHSSKMEQYEFAHYNRYRHRNL